MKTTVFLVRHGEIDNPNKIIYGSNIDLKLSEAGRKQISGLSRKISAFGYKIDKIYSSPLLRAKETAETLSDALRVKNIIIEPNFMDDDMPGLAGKPLTMLSQFNSAGMDQYSKEYLKLGNESQESVAKRVRLGFYDILRSNYGKNFIIVSHGNPISFLLFQLLNPQKNLPSIKILLKHDFLKKGQAFKLVIEEGKVLDKRIIS